MTDHRKRVDFAECIRLLVDVMYPEADKIVLVMDNLNTHTIASLYEAFEPAEARRLAKRLEIHVCSETWKLAGYGRDGTERIVPAVFGPVL